LHAGGFKIAFFTNQVITDLTLLIRLYFVYGIIEKNIIICFTVNYVQEIFVLCD